MNEFKSCGCLLSTKFKSCYEYGFYFSPPLRKKLKAMFLCSDFVRVFRCFVCKLDRQIIASNKNLLAVLFFLPEPSQGKRFLFSARLGSCDYYLRCLLGQKFGK